MKGYIHSIESFGSVDGPGIRFVVFMQGCPMRCLYCHNPDTWDLSVGKQMSVEEILTAYEKNSPFYKNGGLTVSGGEPLMQMDFLIELFEAAREKRIHTCLDTSGIVFNENNVDLLAKFDRLVKVTDLVMLDIKHIDTQEHLKLTKNPNTQILKFAQYLDSKDVSIWIRHVVVPGITDNERFLFELGYFIGGLFNLKALDVLPYHTMGTNKYKEMGIDYPLKELSDMTKEDAIKAKKFIIDGIKKRRAELVDLVDFTKNKPGK
jgi:pyruvate formate lyase activating enzyme